MAPHDNEKRFEDALARHLRRGVTRGGAREDAACPDAEILAAYHERSLAPEELRLWKDHIAACARCQEILSTVEIADQVHAGQHEQKEVAAAHAPVAALRAAAPEVSGEAWPRAVAASPARSGALRRRFLYWRWLAPAGAIAAGLLVWIAVREKPVARLPAEPSVMVAKNQTAPGATRAQATPPAKSAQPESAPLPERLGQETLDGRRPNSQVLSREQASNEAVKEPAKKRGFIGRVAGGEFGRLKASPRDDKSAPLPAGTPVGQAAPSRAAKDASPAVSVDGLRGGSGDQAVDTRNAKIESAKQPAEGNASKKESAAARAAPPAPAPAEPNRTSVETYAAAPQSETALTEKQKKPAEHPTASAAYELRAENSKMLSGGIKPRKVFTFAPDSAVRWSFGPSGLILRSTDGGKSWNQQQSGTTADLAAGSAPSEKVCWVVGAKGTILLTTNGEHWTKILSPAYADLIGVVAQDARRAEVWSDAREAHYVTQDGGQTWTQRGAQ